jgi:hypothetical protein
MRRPKIYPSKMGSEKTACTTLAYTDTHKVAGEHHQLTFYVPSLLPMMPNPSTLQAQSMASSVSIVETNSEMFQKYRLDVVIDRPRHRHPEEHDDDSPTT